MTIRIDAFAVAKRYLGDYQGQLSSSDVQFLQGSLRSRCLANLTDPWRDIGPDKRGTAESRVISQVAAFFKKNVAFSRHTLCQANAQQNFFRAKTLCAITNKRLDWFDRHPNRLSDERQRQVKHMQVFITRVLGPLPAFLDQLPGLMRVTSGASESKTRERSVPFMKFTKRIRCSSLAVPLVKALCTFLTGRDVECITTDANRIVCVPKNWKVYRTIAAEPVGNLPIQLGVDSYLKGRLRRMVGIDLTDQSVNRSFARKGSIDNRYATVDLSMASDTMAYNLIPYLLPFDWFEFLNRLRSRSYKGPFGEGKYAMFSSMGNGFTFSLETLIFAAACSAVGSRDYVVYGDDIALEADRYDDLRSLLGYLGFQVNTAKSFASGPFRESCGADYHDGINIRPFFLKNDEFNKAEACQVINNLVRVGLPYGTLWQLCKKVVIENRLSLTCANTNESSGVFIDLADAKRLGCVKTVDWITYIRSYVIVRKTACRFNIRSLLLWHFTKLTQEIPVEVSQVPTASLKVRRAWVAWDGDLVAKDHIEMWSNFLLDKKGVEPKTAG